jgi:bacteriocin-like protein
MTFGTFANRQGSAQFVQAIASINPPRLEKAMKSTNRPNTQTFDASSEFNTLDESELAQVAGGLTDISITKHIDKPSPTL